MVQPSQAPEDSTVTRRISRVAVLAASFIFVALAAGSLGATAQTPPPATGALPTSGLTASLKDAANVTKGGPIGAPTLDQNPVAPGAVEARWYQASGNYVVYLSGLTLPTKPSVCIVTYLPAGGSSNSVTAAVTTADGCGYTSALTPNAALLCGGKVFSLTAISITGVGDLYATVERVFNLPDGTRVESIVESRVKADASKAPALDMTGCTAIVPQAAGSPTAQAATPGTPTRAPSATAAATTAPGTTPTTAPAPTAPTTGTGGDSNGATMFTLFGAAALLVAGAALFVWRRRQRA